MGKLSLSSENWKNNFFFLGQEVTRNKRKVLININMHQESKRKSKKE